MAAGLLGGAESASAQTFDAFKEFKLKDNPNGDWSYLFAGQLLTTKLKACGGVTKFQCWWNDGQEPDSSVVGANKSGTTLSFETINLPPKHLLLDPESNADVSAQWTAPSAGSVEVTGNFLGVDTNEASHSVAILHNGTALKTFTMSAYQQESKFHLAFQVAAGDTISFASYTNGWTNLSTGLQATIKLN